MQQTTVSACRNSAGNCAAGNSSAGNIVTGNSSADNTATGNSVAGTCALWKSVLTGRSSQFSADSSSNKKMIM